MTRIVLSGRVPTSGRVESDEYDDREEAVCVERNFNNQVVIRLRNL